MIDDSCQPELRVPGGPHYKRIDHIAIAVRNLEDAITFYGNNLGFTLVRRLEVRGKHSGMISAEMECGNIKFVLCQGTEPESQVSLLIDSHGPGVAHIALEVDNLQETIDQLSKRSVSFDTPVIGAGTSLEQAFSTRDSNSGMAFELIKRNNESGFVKSNVQELFDQLEKSGSY